MEEPRVLIIDDDDGVRRFLVNLLGRSGYSVVEAADGRAGLEVFEKEGPDLCLVDMRMPRMNGREFIEAAMRAETEAVFVVLTGHGTVEEAVELMRLGVYSVLTKPLDVDGLLFMVEKALRERSLKERSRELEHRLEISERLAMIGKLAAGVAHELNSPLDGVIRFVRLTRDGLREGSDLRDFQDEALKGLSRMSSIVKDLLTFSRNIALEVEEEALEKQVREAAAQVLGSRRDKAVRVTYEFAVPDVSVPRGLFQVFQNLLKNAVDAVEAGGEIGVRARLEDGEVEVEIRDDGPGIPPEDLERVFEPFFTTKQVGEGTGLGLSIVMRIMERFGGGVRIESVEGEGTRVTAFLPAKTRHRERRDEEELERRTGLHTPR